MQLKMAKRVFFVLSPGGAQEVSGQPSVVLSRIPLGARRSLDIYWMCVLLLIYACRVKLRACFLYNNTQSSSSSSAALARWGEKRARVKLAP